MRTRTPIGRTLVAAATLVVAGVAVVVGGVRAEPATAAASCVAVVVDFHLLGGSVQTGCAQGDPTTGLQALTKAGFSYTPRARDGLICQIDAKPACTDTTTTKYWSYWYRAPGSSTWVYATAGAGSHNPKPGSTEGWVWQDGGKTPPPAIRADVICPQLTASPTPTRSKTTKPTPKPTPKPTKNPQRTPAASASSTGTPTTKTGRSPSATASSDTPTPATSPTTSGSASPLAFTAGGSSGGATPAQADDGGGGDSLGGPAALALGGVVVVGIGAAAAIRARRGKTQ